MLKPLTEKAKSINTHNLLVIGLVGLSMALYLIVKIRKADAKVYTTTGEHQFETIRRKVKSGNCEGIDNAIRALKRIKKSQGNLHFFKGICLFKEGKVEEALHSFNNTLKIDPTNAEALNNRANILLYHQNNLEAAIQDYTKAIQLQPKETNFRINRALAHEKLKEYDLALDDLAFVIKQNPKMALAWLLKGNIQHQQRQFKPAINSFNRALWLNNNLIESYTSRGLSRIEMGNRRWGCHDLKIATSRGSSHAQNHWNQLCK